MCISLNEQWEQKNPSSKMTVGIGNEAWEISWITNYLAAIFTEEKLSAIQMSYPISQYDFESNCIKENVERIQCFSSYSEATQTENNLFI